MDEVTRCVLVAGSVQGVGYRMACAAEAGRLGLAGYARNCDDGRVEVVARGAPEDVASLLDWCRVGPPGARVLEVAETSVPAGASTAEAAPAGSFRVR